MTANRLNLHERLFGATTRSLVQTYFIFAGKTIPAAKSHICADVGMAWSIISVLFMWLNNPQQATHSRRRWSSIYQSLAVPGLTQIGRCFVDEIGGCFYCIVVEVWGTIGLFGESRKEFTEALRWNFSHIPTASVEVVNASMTSIETFSSIRCGHICRSFRLKIHLFN